MKRIIYVAVFCMCMTGAANADSFSFKIMSEELGYNSAGIFKTDNNPNVMIHTDDHLAKLRTPDGTGVDYVVSGVWDPNSIYGQ